MKDKTGQGQEKQSPSRIIKYTHVVRFQLINCKGINKLTVTFSTATKKSRVTKMVFTKYGEENNCQRRIVYPAPCPYRLWAKSRPKLKRFYLVKPSLRELLSDPGQEEGRATQKERIHHVQRIW